MPRELSVPGDRITVDEQMVLANAQALIDQTDETFYLETGSAERFSANQLDGISFPTRGRLVAYAENRLDVSCTGLRNFGAS